MNSDVTLLQKHKFFIYLYTIGIYFDNGPFKAVRETEGKKRKMYDLKKTTTPMRFNIKIRPLILFRSCTYNL